MTRSNTSERIHQILITRLRIPIAGLMMATALLLLLAGCSSKSAPASTAATPPPSMTMTHSPEAKFTFASPDIAAGVQIPLEYSKYGQNTSPALTWTTPPANTAELIVHMDDRFGEGQSFTHWLVYGIAPANSSFTRNAVPGGAIQGANSGGENNYYGPEPPPGESHDYHFTIYALSKKLDVAPGANWKTVKVAMEGNLLGQAEFSAPFKRP